MLKRLKRAFTIMELVIVIAVIAILAAVLIPTFSNVVQNAKVSNDTQTASTLNVALAAYNVEDPITSEDDLRAAVDGTYGEGYYDSLEPESAEYGYHFWYNTETNRIELSRSEDLGSAAEGAQAQKASAKLTKSAKNAEFRAEGMRGALKEGYVLLDRSGSTVADTLKQLENLTDGNSYKAAIENAGNLERDSYDSSLAENLQSSLSATVMLTNSGAFRYDEGATQIQFASGITTIVGTIYVYHETNHNVTQTMASETNPTVNYEGDITLPESVTLVDSYGLYFENGDSVTFTVPSAIDTDNEMSEFFSANATNAKISRGGVETGYRIDGDKLLDDNNQQVGNTLKSNHPIASFDIGVKGTETAGGTYSVALDTLNDKSLSLYATNFLSTDGGNVVSDANVTWEITSSPANSSASINENGVITNLTGGQYTITATSVQNSEVTASITLRIGAVINTSSMKFTGNNLEQQDGVTRKVKIEKDKGGEFNYAVTVLTNFEDIEINTAYKVTASDENVEVSNGTVFVPSGVAEFTLTLKFDNYDVTQTFEFIVEEYVAEFECITPEWEHIGEYLYKVGNKNSINADSLWEFTGEHKNNGLTEDEITIVYEVINSYNNQTLTNQKTQEAAESLGGLQYYQNGSEIGFTGQGVAKINISAVASGSVLNKITVPVEVLDGYNVTTYAELINQTTATSNKMVLSDIAVEQYTRTYAVNGSTLYGNGFTLDGTNASRPANMTWEAVLCVNNAVVDNINIIGQTFPEIDWYNQPYAGYTLSLYGDYCEVYNSYSYGSRAALYVNSEAYIYNTMLEGGVLANIVLETTSVTLEDVATIQNVNSEAIEGGIDENNLGVGLGLFVNENFVNQITITIKGDFRQYNWINSDLADKITDSTYRTLAKYLLNNAGNFKHTIDGAEYVNAGIVFQGEVTRDFSKVLIDQRSDEIKSAVPYGGQTFDASVMKATMFSVKSGADISDRIDSNAFERTFSAISSKPELSLNTSGIDSKYNPEISGNTLKITLEAGQTFTLTSGSLPLSAKYYGRDIDISMISLAADDGTALESLTAEVTSARNIVFRVKVTVSEGYDASGNIITSPQTHYYEFTLNTILDLDDAQVISSGGGGFFYVNKKVSACETNYRTAAYFLDGLVLRDYDPETGTYVETDYTNYQPTETKLPDNFEVVSFTGGSMASASEYEFAMYNNKLIIVCIGASPEKRNDLLKITLSYTGYNGVAIEINLQYQFSSSTTSVDL